MIASKDTLEPKSSDYVMPNSQRVYVEGEIHPEVRVPFREISLAPTKDFNGQLEPNEPVRVYDTSGPWGDPQFAGDSSKGIPAVARGMDPRARGRCRVRRPRDQAGRQRLPHARPRRIRQPGRARNPPRPFPRRESANPSAPAPAIPSRNSGMRARASSRPRWNSSPSAKITGREVCARERTRQRAPIRDSAKRLLHTSERNSAPPPAPRRMLRRIDPERNHP